MCSRHKHKSCIKRSPVFNPLILLGAPGGSGKNGADGTDGKDGAKGKGGAIDPIVLLTPINRVNLLVEHRRLGHPDTRFKASC